MSKKIWIIEDHAAFRRALARVLNAAEGLSCTRHFLSSVAAILEIGKLLTYPRG